MNMTGTDHATCRTARSPHSSQLILTEFTNPLTKPHHLHSKSKISPPGFAPMQSTPAPIA